MQMILAGLMAAAFAALVAAQVREADGRADVAMVCAGSVCVPQTAFIEMFDGYGDGKLSKIEQAQYDALRANNDVLVARAARADCESLLGPLETTARQDEQRKAIERLQQQYARWHQGWTLNDRGQPERIDRQKTPKE